MRDFHAEGLFFALFCAPLRSSVYIRVGNFCALWHSSAIFYIRPRLERPCSGIAGRKSGFENLGVFAGWPCVPLIVAQLLDLPYCTLWHRYTYRTYVFQASQGMALYPPNLLFCSREGRVAGCTTAQPALWRISHYKAYRQYRVSLINGMPRFS